MPAEGPELWAGAACVKVGVVLGIGVATGVDHPDIITWHIKKMPQPVSQERAFGVPTLKIIFVSIIKLKLKIAEAKFGMIYYLVPTIVSNGELPNSFTNLNKMIDYL